MTAPRIIPTTFPLPHAHRMELPTWIAEKLREAFELGGRPTSDMDEANAVYAAVGKAGPVWAGYDSGSDDRTAIRVVTIGARQQGKSLFAEAMRKAQFDLRSIGNQLHGEFEIEDPEPKFWEQVDYLEAIHTGMVILSRNNDPLIAINLPLYEAQCRKVGLIPVPNEVLHRWLPASRNPWLVDKRQYHCRDNRVRFCWMFERQPELVHAPAEQPFDPYLGTR